LAELPRVSTVDFVTLRIPRISVIVPVHDGERFLRQSVDSIRAQRVSELELIIVDDGSTDGTSDLIAELAPDIAIRLPENSGPATARNAGVAAATGEWLAFLDSDDLWTNASLAVRSVLLAQTPNIDIVIGATTPIVDDGTVLPPNVNVPDGDQSGGRVMLFLNVGATLVRREAFESIGSFDESMRFGEDIDWYLRAREQQFSTAYLDDVVLLYRRHGTNMTTDRAATERGFLATMKKSLDRRRTEGAANDLPPVDGLDVFDHLLPTPGTRRS
jgi:glycosyltransferase involved in cell wall biosynthesis